MTAVEVGAREVDAALGRRDNHTGRAHHALGEILSDSTAAVAETELLVAHANNSSIVCARSALSVGGSCVVGGLRGS